MPTQVKNPVTGQLFTPSGDISAYTSKGWTTVETPDAPAAPVVNRYTKPTSGTYASEMEKFLQETRKPVDEGAIRTAKHQEAQAQIDAINKRFDAVIAEDRRLGQGYMGQTRSSAARGGLLGSDFGASQLAETDIRNKAVEAADNARRDLEIQAVWDKVDARATDEINKKNEMALKGQEAYLNWLKENQTEARTDFATLAKTGGIKSLSELTNEDYQKLLDQTGYDEATAKLVFNANLPSKQKVDYQFKIENNKLIAYGIDPATGKVDVIEKQLEDNVPANYKPTVLPDGSLIFTPDKIDPSKPLKDQVIMYGAEGQFAKGSSGKGGGGGNKKNYDAKTIPSDVKSDLLTDINVNKRPKEEVLAAYPEVDTNYISSLYPKEKSDKPTRLSAEDKKNLRAAKAAQTPRAQLIADGYTSEEIDQVYGAGTDFTSSAGSDKPWWKFWAK